MELDFQGLTENSTPLHALETTISTAKEGTLFYQKPLGQRKKASTPPILDSSKSPMFPPW